MANNYSSEWNITSDVYGIVESVDNLKKRYIEDENETTLALGIFGFIGDTEAKKIQTSIIMAGELGNEMFPQRAKLDKNIITHAMYCNITDTNAVPAHMILNLAIKESDLDKYMKNDIFIFDHNCAMYIGDYEFHLDYDIILKRTYKNRQKEYFYNAFYDMSEENNISDINNPYLKQPYMMKFNNYTYIFLQAQCHQVTIETTIDKMITASIIDNKSFTFSFENQLADFEVYITERGTTTKLKPYLYGSSIDPEEVYYCWYLYMNDSSIRISFDQTSYLPGLNAEVKIIAKTTLGSDGNFSYKTDLDDSGFYIDFESEHYNYKKITCYANCATDSLDGQDKKSTDDLKSIIPKMAMSRGSITNDTDLYNYFNLISTDYNKVLLQKKEDNQLRRIWYCYLLMKDNKDNIIPTNTISLKVDSKDKEFLIKCEQEEGRYLLPAGTVLKYDSSLDYAIPIKEEDVPEKFSELYFDQDNIYYYRTIYNLIINENPLYCSYFMTIQNTDGYFEYEYINPNMFMGFIVNSNHFERNLLNNSNEYRLTFNMMQSIDEDFNLYHEEDVNGEKVIVNNMRVFLSISKDGTPYRYTEAELVSYDDKERISSWCIKIHTDDEFDLENNIKLTDILEPGSGVFTYGFFEDNCEAKIYIYAKFDEEYGRYNLDKMIPNMNGWTLVNIYSLANGLSFFNNLTRITDTRIRPITSEDKTIMKYDISGIPVIGEHFFVSEDNVTLFLEEFLKRKSYIDYCISVLKNNMDIDFKFYNTYGYSRTYTIGDKEETSLGDIDIVMKFRMKLTNSTDSTTKNEVIDYIKKYIENLNKTDDLHIPNLLHDIKEEFGNLIVYIEFMNFNNNRLGINHIEKRDDIGVHTVPEFISVRNRYNEDYTELEPCIDIEIVL